MRLIFDDVEVDSELYELRLQGELVQVEPKVFDLIVFLAKSPNTVFSNDDLIDTVWHGRTVSDATVATCIANARKAIGDSGSKQNLIKTVRGRGFRFVAEVSQDNSPETGTLPDSESKYSTNQKQNTQNPTTPNLTQSNLQSTSIEEHADPSLLIIPFRLLSADVESEAGAQ